MCKYNITPQDAKKLMDNNENIYILDIRQQEEYDSGHIKNAILIPPEYINIEYIESIIDDKDSLILVYCHAGTRANLALLDLRSMGYNNVYNFGGVVHWPYGLET